MIPMRRMTTVGTGCALVIATAAALVSSTASATTGPPASADESRTRPNVQVLRFIDKVGPNSNTDIDLGVPGFSVGNQQLFSDELVQNGRRIGTSIGVAQIVALTDTTLTAQIVSTAILPAGTLTTQMAFVEILADGPPAVMRSAITGGTGAYSMAQGDCVARSFDDTDDVAVTCTIVLR